MTHPAAVWQHLAEAGIVSGTSPPSEPPPPWYVRALLGIGGWLAAIFILAFMGIEMFPFNQPGTMTVVGLLMIAGASVVFYAREINTFVAQAALAVSFAGQTLVIVGTAQLLDDARAIAFAIAALEAVLAVLVPYGVHRMFCAAAAGIALAIALMLSGAHYLSAGLLAAMIGTLWLNEFAWAARGSTVRPVAYGLTLALLAVQATWFARVHEFLWHETPQWLSPQIGAAVPGIVFMIVAAQLLVH